MKKLCLIGCGLIGNYHLGHFLQRDKFGDFELAGFCDKVLARAEEFVKKAGSGKAYKRLRCSPPWRRPSRRADAAA